MSDLLKLEGEIADAEILIARRQAAQRLANNRDFRELFIDGYFEKEAARLVQLSSDPALNKEQREDCLDEAKATGHAKRYFTMVEVMGAHYERVLPEMKALRDVLRSESEG